MKTAGEIATRKGVLCRLFWPDLMRVVPVCLFRRRNAQLVLPEAAAAHEGGHVRAVQDRDGQGHGVRRGEHQVRAVVGDVHICHSLEHRTAPCATAPKYQMFA